MKTNGKKARNSSNRQSSFRKAIKPADNFVDLPTSKKASASLTRGERRWVWICSAIFLGVLLALFFIGLFLPIGRDHPLLDGFYSISHIVAAVAAGALAATITGYLDVFLEKNLGNTGRIAIRGGGGFAVFLLVLWSNPKAQMFSLADKVALQSAVATCTDAVEGGRMKSDARSLCTLLTERYPDQPEAWRLYGNYWYRIDGTPESLKNAVDAYIRGLEAGGINDPFDQQATVLTPTSSEQGLLLSRIVLNLALAQADWSLQTRSFGGLEDALTAGRKAVELGGVETDPERKARVNSLRGIIALYRTMIIPEKKAQYLEVAKLAYEDSVRVRPRQNFHAHYHLAAIIAMGSRWGVENYSELSALAHLKSMKDALKEFERSVNGGSEAPRLRALYRDCLLGSDTEPFYRASMPFRSVELMSYVDAEGEALEIARQIAG